MADRTLRALILGDSSSAEAAMGRTAASADAAATTVETRFDAATTHTGSAFSKLGSGIENWLGIPIASTMDKVGSKFDEAQTHGNGFRQMLSTLGGATLLGATAGFVALSAEGIHLADSFDTAEASLKTATNNAGANFEALKPKVDQTYDSMAKLGFNSTDTANALTALTTATGSPTVAMKDLAVAADLARLKHVSLDDATGILTKTLAGSTRALTSMGINLDIGSAKLASAHSATDALATAELAYQHVEENVSSGKLKGAAASQALETAQNTLRIAQDNVNRDQSASGQIMDALVEKTKGAADAYGTTLPGKMAVAQATAHNLGTEFGQFLTPKLEELGQAVFSVINWFEQHKVVAEALAATIGTVLAGAVAVYTINVGQKAVDATQRAISSIGTLVTAIFGQETATETLNAQMVEQNALFDTQSAYWAEASSATTLQTSVTTTLAAADERLAATEALLIENQTALTTSTEVLAEAQATLGGTATTTAGEMDVLGASTAATGEKAAVAGGAGGVGRLAGFLEGGAGAALGVAAGFGVLALAMQKLVPPTPNAADQMRTAVDELNKSLSNLQTSTPDQLAVSLQALQVAVDGVGKHAQSSTNLWDNFAHTLDISNAKLTDLQSKSIAFAEAQATMTGNVQTLTSAFGISSAAAEQLAQQLGINLGRSLDTSQVQAFGNAVAASGQTLISAGTMAAPQWAQGVTQAANQAVSANKQGNSQIEADTAEHYQLLQVLHGSGGVRAIGAFINSQQGGLPQVEAVAQQWGVTIPQQYLAVLEGAMDQHGHISMQRLTNAANSEIGPWGDTMNRAGNTGGQRFADGTNSRQGDAAAAGRNLNTAGAGGASDTGPWTAAGQNVAAAFAAAIGSVSGSISAGISGAISSGVSSGEAQALGALSMINLTANAGLPGHATGYYGSTAHFASISEGNATEAVLPLSDTGRTAAVLAQILTGNGGAALGAASAAAGGSSAPVSIVVNASITVNGVNDPEQLAQQLVIPLQTAITQAARSMAGQSYLGPNA